MLLSAERSNPSLSVYKKLGDEVLFRRDNPFQEIEDASR